MSRDDVIGERIDPITGVKVSEYAEESQEVGESADSPEDIVERIDPITGVKVSEEDAPTG